MTAGQVWRRDDGLRWAEIQTEAMEPSGWRLMVPLVGPDAAPEAPPLIVAASPWRARVHLVTSAHTDHLGELDGELEREGLAAVRAAVHALVGDT